MATVSPVETISFTPKSQEASILHVNKINKENAQQTMTNVTMQSDFDKSQHRTEKATDKDQMAFKYDAKDKGNGEYTKNESERREKEKKKKDDEHGRLVGSSFDVTV